MTNLSKSGSVRNLRWSAAITDVVGGTVPGRFATPTDGGESGRPYTHVLHPTPSVTTRTSRSRTQSSTPEQMSLYTRTRDPRGGKCPRLWLRVPSRGHTSMCRLTTCLPAKFDSWGKRRRVNPPGLYQRWLYPVQPAPIEPLLVTSNKETMKHETKRDVS